MLIHINGREIGKDNPTYIVAELSANHNQDLSTALKLVEEAKSCGVDAIKIQTYNPDTITLNCRTDVFKIKGTIWEDQYLYDLYKKAYTPWEWHEAIFNKAKELGLDYFSSPFDESAVDFLETLNIPCYKIASCEITDFILLKKIAQTKKPVIMSTGMASFDEISDAVNVLRQNGTTEISVLKCTSEYPARIEDANLETIRFTSEKLNVVGGLSDHTLTTEIPMISIGHGASIIEKHFTLKRDGVSPDDSFSLEPHEFKQMVISVRTAEKARGKIFFGGVKGEEATKKFRRSLFFVKDMKKGDIIDKSCIRSVRPGCGLHTKFYDILLGKKVRENISFGTPTSLSLVE